MNYCCPQKPGTTVLIDPAALRRALNGRSPALWPDIERTIWRALAGRRISLGSFDAICEATGA